MTKITFIIPYLSSLNRGIERSGFNLAKALGVCGNDVSILYWRNFREKRIVQENQVKTIPLTIPRYYRAWIASWKYLFYLLFNRPDIVVIYYAGHGEAWPIRITRKFIRFHLSFIVGYPIETVPHRFQEFKTLGLVNLLDSIIVKSPFMVKGVEAFFQKPVQMVTNGIDLDYFQLTKDMKENSIRKELGIPSEAIVLLSVAALEKRKGMQYVIDAMERLKEININNIYYIILGEGNDRKYFEEKIENSVVRDKIHLLGTKKEVRPYYAISNLVFLLSYGEGFPNVLLEAWAMELPIAVSDAPPYPDITDSDNAYMFSIEDTEGLDNLLLRYSANKEALTKIGKQNRTFVTAHYSWPIIARRYQQIFRS